MSELYSPKDPIETVTCSLDFTKPLAAIGGGTITACVVDVSRVDGKTEDTSAMVVGSCDITAKPILKQNIGGGTNGVNYLIRFKATVGSQYLAGSATMLVKTGA